MLVHPVGTRLPVSLQLADAPPREPVRVHLDLYTSDHGADVEWLLGLGATRVAEWPYPADPDFVVLRDPDGNEFCVIDHAGPLAIRTEQGVRHRRARPECSNRSQPQPRRVTAGRSRSGRSGSRAVPAASTSARRAGRTAARRAWPHEGPDRPFALDGRAKAARSASPAAAWPNRSVTGATPFAERAAPDA